MSTSEERLEASLNYYQRLNKLKDHVSQNSSRHLTLQEAAQIAGLERKYFSTYFRTRTGTCFKDWLAEVRVKKAMALMSEKDYGITEIAYDVGFRDLRAFERAFKRLTGMTPRDFRTTTRP